MKNFFKILAVVGLLMTLVPSIIFYFNVIEIGQMKLYMAIGTLLWFAGAIPWLGQKRTKTDI
ncbi:MAG: hypothetical protein K8R52_01300 [Bacteroidales bacterium]|nr:hypothetical protein [Bacteroidales bacterium]